MDSVDDLRAPANEIRYEMRCCWDKFHMPSNPWVPSRKGHCKALLLSYHKCKDYSDTVM